MTPHTTPLSHHLSVEDGQHSKLLAPILSVISPCLKFLQLYISSQNLAEEKILSKLLGVCGEMAVTLCAAVPKIHNDDVTQRTVAFVWFVYELAHSHGMYQLQYMCNVQQCCNVLYQMKWNVNS